MGDNFFIHIQTISDYEGSLCTNFSSQMKSVQTNFHLLNVHFTTQPNPPRKRAKNSMVMGIAKFNLEFRITCTWEW